MNETKELTPEQKTKAEGLHKQIVNQLFKVSVDLMAFRSAPNSEVDALTEKIVKGIEGYVSFRIEMDRVLRGAA